MKSGKTELIIILDRSGSMSGIRSDMEGGLKGFIEKQKALPGECLVSLYQFDDIYETVFETRPVKDVGEIKLVPRNSTALYDAMAKTINAVGERLEKTPESERPTLVMIMTITDGQENASKEFAAAQVKTLVEHQIKTYSWDFTFLGANQDAVLTAQSLGIAGGKAMTYNATKGGSRALFNSAATYTSSVRTDINEFGNLARVQSIEFTEEDRKEAVEAKPN